MSMAIIRSSEVRSVLASISRDRGHILYSESVGG